MPEIAPRLGVARPAGSVPRLRAAAGPRVLSPTLMVLAVATVFGVSGGMLWDLGINYDGLTGGAPAKIHPSTYVLMLAFGVALLRSGDPLHLARWFAEQRPASALLLLAALVSLADVALRHGPGLAGVIDTFVPAALVVMLLTRAEEGTIRAMTIVLHLVMTANAVLGLVEFATHQLFFPFRFDGAVFPLDTRSAALQGHPLANAAVTGLYILALVATGGASLPSVLRLPMLALQFAALITFGGRTALVVSLVLGALRGFGSLAAAMQHRSISLLGLAMTLLGGMGLVIAIGVLFEGGFFTALIGRFASDGGSAYARVQMFDMFDNLPFRDLLVGPDPALIDSTRRILGLEWGIENPFVKTLLYQGIIVTAMMTVAVCLYVYELARAAGPGTLLPILGFVVLTVTSESIGGKTTLLTKFALMLICLYAPMRRRWITVSLDRIDPET